ncbi:MAG TPA: DAK2 domain-containing protein, partial [Xanthobacteraceae bacterium]|nr:DAK2 domain-containing protein [Xanthobacteraceae bacterium]
MNQALQKRLIEAVATSMIDHAEELTILDQAIGDGDHGLNMRRGFTEVMADVDGLATRPLPEALRAIGTKLVMKVGGASGPLYGTLFLTLGKELPDAPTQADAARALGIAVAAVM